MTRFTRTALTVASAVALTAAPAFAQHRGGGHGGASHGGGGGGRVAHGYTARAGSAPRGSYAVRGGAYRGGVYARPGSVYRGGVYARGVYGGGRYLRVAPTRFYRPYYAFRPRFSLGFGLFAGYPFAYNYGYYDPFAYGYPYPYSYAYPYEPYPYGNSSVYPNAPQGSYAPPVSGDSIAGQADQANMGGLSFEITPADAQLFIDGRPAGTVGEFTPTSQPLGLPAGRHHVEIRAAGYRTMSVDVDIVAGQVIPYQGTMER